MGLKLMEKLAVAIMTLNEELDIVNCINSAKNLKCKIFVFDSGSTDKTLELSKTNGAYLVNFRWDSKYPKKKQWILNYLKSDFEWVLILDADESLSAELAEEISTFIKYSTIDFSAMSLKLDYYFNNKRLRFGNKVLKTSFVKPKYVQFPEIADLKVVKMGEVEGHYQPRVTMGKSGIFRHKLTHRDSGEFFEYLHRHNKYSDWEAFVNTTPEVRQLVYEHRPFRAKLLNHFRFRGLMIFIYSYIFKFGFLDGRGGFDYALNQAFYYWQIAVKEKLIRNG